MFATLLLASLCSFVDPFVGTTFTGHTYPAACVPFGLVQAGPDTGNFDWHHCSGYRYEETTLRGFSQTHLNGTGVGDLGDVLLLPFAGEKAPESYELDKLSEKASPGHYAVRFGRGAFAAEVAASEHCAIYRFTRNGEEPLRLLFDGQWAVTSWSTLSNRVKTAAVELDDDRCGFAGSRTTTLWVERDLGFAVRFDRPCVAVERFLRRPYDKADSLAFTFDVKRGETLSVKVGLSGRGSSAAAKRNLAAEIPDFDFVRVKTAAEADWEKMLSRVEVEGSDDGKRNFYTSLYHLFQQPNNLADVGEKPFYSTFSCWDTFRAAHPLYTILCPERVPDMVDSLVVQGKSGGFLPVWTLWGKDNQCMIATHSIPVIVDAYLKGLVSKDFDARAVYSQIKDTLTKKHVNRRKEGWELLDRYGYFPSDRLDRECVSRTMECCYDDYCAAMMAEKLGYGEDAEYFRKRSSSWKNVFDPETKLVRPKDSRGEWKRNFDPYEIRYGNEYTEGNAFQYTWHVMQDPDGLVAALGGREAALRKLDELFTLKSADEGEKVLDVTGSIGQYVHGNEPSHHIIYFYTLLGAREKAAAKVEEVFRRFYLPKPDGLCGNDDCGQMSAWYVFSAAGFYPFNPCGGEYVLGSPQFPKFVFRLPGGKTFTVVRSASAADSAASVISHREIMSGGTLTLR